MATATWNGVTVARSDDTVVVEGNHYFPRESLREDLVVASATTSVCPWKGTASYLSLRDGDASSTDAVWYYPAPKDAASEITGRVAFWKDVVVTD